MDFNYKIFLIMKEIDCRLNNIQKRLDSLEKEFHNIKVIEKEKVVFHKNYDDDDTFFSKHLYKHYMED